MSQCTLCKKEHVPHFNISGLYICKECAKKEGYSEEDYRTCCRCLRTTSKFHGNQSEEGFKCNVCIQEEYDDAMFEFLEDPQHSNIPIDDLFVQKKKKYRNAVIISLLILISSIISMAIYLLKSTQPESTHEDNSKHIEQH